GGRRTVAACEAGGPGGGVALSPEVLLSLEVQPGDTVALTCDFDACEAQEVDVAAPRELLAAWPELMGGLQLDRYLRAALDGALLTAGDARALSAGGRAWRLRVAACRGSASGGEASTGPMLVAASTSVKVSLQEEEPAAEAGGQPEATEEAGALRGFARVGGLRGVLDELREAVQLPLERPELYRRLGVGPPRGVLLYGPPGSGDGGDGSRPATAHAPRPHDAILLFLHGLESGPSGSKAQYLRQAFPNNTVLAPDNVEMSALSLTKRNSLLCNFGCARWSMDGCVQLALDALKDALEQLLGGGLGGSTGFGSPSGPQESMSGGGPEHQRRCSGCSLTGILCKPGCPCLDEAGLRPCRVVLLAPALDVCGPARAIWPDFTPRGFLEEQTSLAAAVPRRRCTELLVLHGDGDTTVPVEASRALARQFGARLPAAGGAASARPAEGGASAAAAGGSVAGAGAEDGGALDWCLSRRRAGRDDDAREDVADNASWFRYEEIAGGDHRLNAALIDTGRLAQRAQSLGRVRQRAPRRPSARGTGKTLLARSLAEEMRCPVELCSSTDLVGSGIGESEERIKAAFDRCRRQAEARGTGALLFIDEIDAVCPKRDDAGEAERRMVAAFLTQLDGVGGTDGLVVLGATNRPEAIDPALRRAGRFERELEVGVPNTEERCQILAVHLAGLRHGLSGEDQRELARRCHGYVGADLRGVCAAAARVALRQGLDTIDLASCLSAMRLVPPSALKELLVEVPEVGWGDIGGYESTKEALREAVEWPIKFGWAFEAMCIDPPKGVLLYGPPGCSKTMMAKAVATETEMNFVSIKGPELFSKYVGDSEKAVRDVFRKARTAAPCVVFFDEVDAIGTRRDEGSSGVAASVLAQLLAEMDGIGSATTARHVVVLAATNRPHMLDPALLRPGRFDRLVHVPLPDEAAREQIFRRQLGRMAVGPGLDAADLARRAADRTGAEVVMVCREAALLAVREALESAARGVEAAPRALPGHFDRALAAVLPRVDAETVQFYIDFEKRMKDG
ncbi:unnamed protein product, partial [Prorocentrum cordatum]